MKTVDSMFRTALLIFVFALCALPAYAQVEVTEEPPAAAAATIPPDSISGVVRPPFGEVFRGASITLTDEATGQIRKATAGADGKYEFKELGNAASFSVYVEPDGFAPTYRPAIAPGNFADFQVR